MRRAGARRGLMGLLLLVGFGCGGALTEAQLTERYEAINDRNTARHTDAVERFAARGYRLLVTERQTASLEPAAGEICAFRHASQDYPDAPPEAHITVTSSSADPSVENTSVELTASWETTCGFFFEGVQEMTGVRGDGEPIVLALLNGFGLAREEATGELVLVAVETVRIDGGRVLVDRSCDHMPSPPDTYRHVSVSVLVGSRPRETVVMPIEREELDVRCTSNTY